MAGGAVLPVHRADQGVYRRRVQPAVLTFGLHQLLARLGFEYRKPKPVPKVAPADKQAEFIALYERLMNELSDEEAVYFADAVHPEYQTKPAFGWVKTGSNPAVKTTAGREIGRAHV